MGAIKNGIRTTLRTPAKALLFFLVLALLAALLSVAFSVFSAVRRYLCDCDDYYHTIVNLEYLGRDYPDALVCDEELARAVEEQQPTLDALCTMEQVLSFEPVSNTRATVKGLHRNDGACYDPEAAVLQIYVIGFDEATDAYYAVIESALYSSTDEAKKMICLRTPDMDQPDAEKPETGATYLMCGHYTQRKTGFIWFQAEPMEAPGLGITVPAFTRWHKDAPELAQYERLAACFEELNSSCRVQYTAAIEDQLPFHQQAITLSQGRLLSDGETGACVISEQLASLLERSCGDSLRLRLYTAQGELYTCGDAEAVAADFEIVGTFCQNDDYTYQIYLPAQTETGRVQPVNGYRLGQFRVRNSGIAAFLEAAQPLEQQGFRLAVYDQGYSIAVEPMQDLVPLSGLFLAICLSLSVALLCLQSYLFISRQRESAQTMLALGSGRAHVLGYFLSGALLLAIPSGLLGCWAGKLLEQRVMRLLSQLARSLASEDLRFSGSRLSLVRTLEFAPTIPLWVYGAAFGVLVLLATLLTLVFGRGALRDRAAKRKKTKKTPKQKPLRRSSHLQGPLKYALLSMRRRTLRSLAVLLLCLVVALFFGQLSDSLRGYRTQLELLQRNTVIMGHATDISGQKLDGLVVSPRSVEEMEKSGLLRSYSVSRKICNLRFDGIPVRADGSEHEVEPPSCPLRVETLMLQMLSEPEWQRSASISGSALFYYAKPTTLEWLDGYGEHSFLGDELICALPQSAMDEHGIKLGDTARFLFVLPDEYDDVVDTVDLKVVGVYQSATDSRTIFSPIGISSVPTELSFDRKVQLGTSTYGSFLFAIDDTGTLEQVRTALAAAGFNYVRSGQRLGNYVVIDDEIYLNTAHAMQRQIRYVQALYSCLYVITGILCLALAWLLTALRKKELALMRALGTQPLRIVANLHFEQSTLCALGLGLGLGIWGILGKPFDRTQLLLTLAFFGIWSLTTLLCVWSGMRKQAYADLAEPE